MRQVLSRKGKLPIAQIEAIETFLRDQPIAPRPEQMLELGLIDADDEWVVASAVLIDADLFVTGYQGALACIAPPIPIINPWGCWEQLRSPG